MIAIDTSALIAILQGEPEAPDFLQILEVTERCVIGSPTKLEALLVAAKRPTGQADIRQLLASANIETIAWTDDHANMAAEAFDRYGNCQLSRNADHRNLPAIARFAPVG